MVSKRGIRDTGYGDSLSNSLCKLGQLARGLCLDDVLYGMTADVWILCSYGCRWREKDTNTYNSAHLLSLYFLERH